MQIDFVKLSPTKNVTVIVEDPVPRADQPELSAKLLAMDSVGGEQVGFLEVPNDARATIRLQMMGGEFCGNASMALGAYVAWRNSLEDGSTMDELFEVSGADELIAVRTQRMGDVYRGTVRMPLPQWIGEQEVETDHGLITIPLVRMPGIAHLILNTDLGLQSEEILRRLPEWNRSVGADALGALLWDEDKAFIDPFVYVPTSGTIVHESGCGSGSCAIGCWKAVAGRRPYCRAIQQPGGEIVVFCDVDGDAFVDLTITGTVAITAKGTAYLQ